MNDPDQSVEFRIRQAKPDDIPAILELIRELADYERLVDHVTATEAALAESLFGPRPAAEALIAELDGHAVGYACFFTSFSSFLGRGGLYVEDIYVRPASRGRGIGRALMSAMAGLAVERRCGRMEWAVLDWNTPSIEFYQRLGAVPMSEWTVFRLTGEHLACLAADPSHTREP